MSRFLYAWELGSHLGHIGTFEPVARELAGSGHDVKFAVRETDQCARLLGDQFSWFQAPIVTERIRPGVPLNYGDILLRCGYDEPDRLLGILVAWRALILSVQPDLILADHAPTAILAARTLGIPVMLFGSGFLCPPPSSPFPAMRPWLPTDEARLSGIDAIALGVINEVLEVMNVPPLTRLCELFDVAEKTLLTFPELDHYPGRGESHYWGIVNFSGARSVPAWPAGKGARIFVYLRHEHPHFDRTLEAIAAVGCPTILFVPGGCGNKVLPPSMTCVTELVDLQEVAAEADLGIAYSSSTACVFLLAGKAMLCLPTHLEQYLLGLRIASLGAGIVVNPGHADPDIAGALNQLLAQGSFTDRAREIAHKYREMDQHRVVKNLAARAQQLASAQRMVTS